LEGFLPPLFVIPNVAEADKAAMDAINAELTEVISKNSGYLLYREDNTQLNKNVVDATENSSGSSAIK
jgi:hypothetical protein